MTKERMLELSADLISDAKAIKSVLWMADGASDPNLIHAAEVLADHVLGIGRILAQAAEEK
ncbi:MAG: hypothetical protein ACOYJU_00865 [Anaerovoracaceae bacterium]|jgi:hypothetical protein